MSNAVEITQLTKKIKGHVILKDINLTIAEGELCGIVGENGSGKSMLFKVICGFISPSGGTAKVFGNLVGNGKYARNTGLLIERPSLLTEYSAMQNLLLLCSIQKKVEKKDIAAIMENLGLDPDDRRPVKKYSLGMKQKLGIAQAIVEGPKLILLDEPSNNLDSGSIVRLHSLLKAYNENNTTIVIASHQREDMDNLAKRVITIHGGSIQSDVRKA